MILFVLKNLLCFVLLELFSSDTVTYLLYIGMENHTSVSYTHLDVYKRQPPMVLMSICKSFC